MEMSNATYLTGVLASIALEHAHGTILYHPCAGRAGCTNDLWCNVVSIAEYPAFRDSFC